MLFRLFTVLAVIALIVSTWELINSGKAPVLIEAKPAATPGYYLKNAVMTDFDEHGEPSLKIGAARIDQVGHGTEVGLIDVRVDYDAPNGQNWVMFGDTAHVEPGGKIVEISGNVRMQGTDPEHAGVAIIRTDTLRYDVSDEIASTKSDVSLDFERHSMTARGLVANLKERTLRLESRVNGRFIR
jgi:LPS export ABC transporter protein LptC